MNIRKHVTAGFGFILALLLAFAFAGADAHAAPDSAVGKILIAHEDDPCAPPPDIEVPPGDDGPDIDFCEDTPDE